MRASLGAPIPTDLEVRSWRRGDPTPERLEPGEEPTDHHLTVLVVEADGAVAATVLVRHRRTATAEIDWETLPGHEGGGVPHRALRLAVDHCFAELGLHRVEAIVPVGDTTRLRIAARAGLRREGVARGAGGPRTDHVRVARLAADPAPDTRDGFIGVLNANLPTKRVISQGVLRDESGRFLLCELTYKREWDLPGGVVDPGESPAAALGREVREELGLDLPVRGLLVVNWMPPWRGWDDASQFVFGLGRHEASLVESMTFEATEIAAVHWCTREEARPHVPDYLDVLLGRLDTHSGGTVYLEGGLPLETTARGRAAR
jgi:RimJ/RimL family protein N-acetyltransferase/8-oxo-dGTP pyrophosphatase MutT (NUDIX family)